MEIRINTESPAARAIIAMAHTAGTAEIYLNTLSRLSNAVLFNQDDMGMDDTETINTIRALSLLRNDIQDIATDKTIAGILKHADDYPDDVKNLAVIPYDPDFSPGNNYRDPAADMLEGLKAVAAVMGDYYRNKKAEGADVLEILDDVDRLIDRLDNELDWFKACAENPDYTDGVTGTPHIRTLSYLAHSKAVHSFEYLEDIQDRLTREGYPAEKIAEIAEATKLQKKAADILERNLAELYTSEAKEEGDDDGK